MGIFLTVNVISYYLIMEPRLVVSRSAENTISSTGQKTQKLRGNTSYMWPVNLI